VCDDVVDRKLSCPICREDYEARSEAVRLPCLHYFCKDCITPWLSKVALILLVGVDSHTDLSVGLWLDYVAEKHVSGMPVLHASGGHERQAEQADNSQSTASGTFHVLLSSFAGYVLFVIS